MILYEFFAQFSSELGFCTLFRPTRRFSFIGLFRLSYLEPVLLIPKFEYVVFLTKRFSIKL